jgi:Planctomycete cytochrome C
MEDIVPRLALLVGGVVALAGVGIAAILDSPTTVRAAPAVATVSFSEDILPLLKWRCSGCHEAGGQGYEKSGLDLTSYAGVMKGTKYGPMVIPSDPGTSNLMVLLDWPSYLSPELRMPHGRTKISVCDRDLIRTWIKEGAQNN